MSDKYYNLTKQPNEGVHDEAPSWMDSLFEKKEAVVKKENPFENSENLFKTSTNVNKNCRICGKSLNGSEVSYCSKCK